jgi:multisubunit Na+/H+ antiporter MnhG subunit
MGLDVRIPIGLMFSIMGLMLSAFGALSRREIYQRSLGINVNLIWGLVLLVVGLILLLSSRKNTHKRSKVS